MNVSVCLAAYNGERFIAEQLQSILAQLSPSDELIVCDDSSRDHTREVVGAIADPRLVLRSFGSNVGHVRNFERALASARGDLIFLSDQDDVWVPDKISTVVSCFIDNPEVQLVHHALSTINSQGETLAPLWNPLHEGRPGRFAFLVRQFVKCQVFGCAVAFRRSLLEVALPFPATAYAHDHWLAAAAGICGPVYFLNRPLVRYRLHTNNVTPRNGLRWWAQIAVRLKFLGMVGVAIGRRFRTAGGHEAVAG